MAARSITVYIDYKSPYAYLAKDPAWELEREFDVRLDWLPYTLDIPEFLGTVEGRNPHQWRRVRYSYMGRAPARQPPRPHRPRPAKALRLVDCGDRDALRRAP
jgi:2-hydroxychromene-2-carboxylate isomerase